MIKTITLEKGFYNDWCDWEETITATISTELEAQIKVAQSLISKYRYIQSINLDVPAEFLSETTEAVLQEQCRFDVTRLIVYGGETANCRGFVLNLQAKWDNHIQAEYTVL